MKLRKKVSGLDEDRSDRLHTWEVREDREHDRAEEGAQRRLQSAPPQPHARIDEQRRQPRERDAQRSRRGRARD